MIEETHFTNQSDITEDILTSSAQQSENRVKGTKVSSQTSPFQWNWSCFGTEPYNIDQEHIQLRIPEQVNSISLILFSRNQSYARYISYSFYYSSLHYLHLQLLLCFCSNLFWGKNNKQMYKEASFSTGLPSSFSISTPYTESKCNKDFSAIDTNSNYYSEHNRVPVKRSTSRGG